MRKILIITVSFFLAAALCAQRKVTPVEPETEKKAPKLYYYDKHGNPLKEPVEFLIDTDTTQHGSAKPEYPLLYATSIGVNFFDAAMLIAGQKHASFDIWADLSLHNWFFPVVEAGIGYAKNTPDQGNFTYVGKPSFYAKVGLNYNFLYKSNPDYQVYLGLRGCFSSFSYDIKDITINSGYWDQSNRLNILGQRSSVFFGEVLAGIKVKIYKHFSLGWSARFHFKFHTKPGKNSQPWFIPGYGTNSPITATFSAIYTIPLAKKTLAETSEVPSKKQ